MLCTANLCTEDAVAGSDDWPLCERHLSEAEALINSTHTDDEGCTSDS